MPIEKQARLENANALIRYIADHGRRFFRMGIRVSQLERDSRGRVWFVDKYTGKRIYTHYRGRWRGFSEGGTLQCLVLKLVRYIVHGDLVPANVLGPWPDWYCGGDLWEYGDSMQAVRDEAARLGITTT